MQPTDETMAGNTGSEEETVTPATPAAASDENQPKSDGKKTYSEIEYKGLQAVIAKRDTTILNLTTELADTKAKLTEALENQATTVNEKTSLDAKFTDTQTKLTAIESEKNALQKIVSEQKIIMQEFPDLAPAYSFIPKAETEEEFREKAKELRSTLKQLVNNGVQTILTGSSPSTNMTGSELTPLGGDDEDKAYRLVAALAGRPGKEKEFEEANERYQKILAVRQKT